MATPTFTDEVVFPTDPVAGYVGQAGNLAPGVYLRLNDAVASPTAADASGFANTGTVHGTITFQSAGFIANNKAALFDGTTGYITVPSSTTWQPSTSVSVAFWAQFTTLPTVGNTIEFLQAFDGGFLTIFEASLSNGNGTGVPLGYYINWNFTDTGAVTRNVPLTLGGLTLTTGTPYFFVITDDGASAVSASGVNLYINGVLAYTGSRPANAGGFDATTYTLTVGATGGTPSGFFPGTLDEVMVVPNVVLDARTIASLYGSAGITPTAQLVYTTLTNRPMNISSIRGKQHELDVTQAGTATSQLLHLDQALDPTNTASPYYPNVKPLRRFRRRATVGGVTYPVFAGFVERWPQHRVGPTYADVPLVVVDGFESLNLAQVTGTFPQELSGARINRVLNLVFWPSADRNIAAGDSLMQAVTFTTRVSALQHLQDIEKSERGWLFMSRDGKVTWLNRHATLPQLSASVASFSDQPQAGSVYPYADLTALDFSRDLIWNDWTDTPQGFSAPAHAEDAASIQSYFRRSQSMNSQLVSFADAYGGVQYSLTKSKDPLLNIDQMKLRPGNDTGFWQTILARDLGDRITVSGTPPGGVKFTKDFLISQIQMTTPADVADTTVTWNLLPGGDTLTYWQLGVAGFSELGVTTRVVW